MKRCGKPGCRCARGELHRAHYRMWRDKGGRLRKEYVRARDVEAVKAACQLYRETDEAMQAIITGADAGEIKRQFRAQLRRAGAPAEIVRQFR